jgi:hypothetical protein
MKLTEKLAWLNAHMRRADLSSTAKVVLSALVERCDASGTSFPSLARIAADVGLARSGAIRGVRELVEAGVVDRRQRRSEFGDLDSTSYTINFNVVGRPEHGSTWTQERVDRRPEDGSTGRPRNGSENPPIGSLPLNPSASSKRPDKLAKGNEHTWKKGIFDTGVRVLVGAGVEERPARALIGKLRKHHGDEEAFRLVTEAGTKSDPRAWLASTMVDPSELPYAPMGRGKW